MLPPIAFDNSYARLPPRFFAQVGPQPVRAPRLVKVNVELAALLGIDAEFLASPAGVDLLAGNAFPSGAEPIALAYAGHQFGSFVPRLGDGRAVLVGEIVGTDGRRRDLQLKGSGRTPFSRGGDGRAALGPVMREYIVSEAMAALGVPTTRSLAAVTTGEPVYRESVLPGAVLARVAASHLRVGTFEYLAARGDREGLEVLTRYALARHEADWARNTGESHDEHPSAIDAADAGAAALRLLDRVIAVQAELVARWLGLGFVHGVMNTDNTSIAGETIDYGPCAFLDTFEPDRSFSSIDHGGRYAFENQPRIAMWNLARLAEALLPLVVASVGTEEEAVRRAKERLDEFPKRFHRAHGRVLRGKLGFSTERGGDAELASALLGALAEHQVDHTLFFRRLCDAAESPAHDADVAALFADPADFARWAESWRKRLGEEPVETQSPAARAASMRRANPAFIPRNHRVEQAIEAAAERNDLRPFETLVTVLARPYEDQPEAAHLAEPPDRDEQREYRTFCGT